MISVWVLVRWVHLLHALHPTGAAPVVRPALDADKRAMLVGKVGARYGVISVIALILLLITGYLTGERRAVDWTNLTASEYGTRLLVKLILVAVVAVTAFHTWYGRRIVALAGLPPEEKQSDQVIVERRRLHILSGSLSALNLALNLVIVWLAASLIA
ncbi:hypothetical protein BH23CHL2_BH23CHL2_23960 [soil metagenome]